MEYPMAQIRRDINPASCEKIQLQESELHRTAPMSHILRRQILVILALAEPNVPVKEWTRTYGTLRRAKGV